MSDYSVLKKLADKIENKMEEDGGGPDALFVSALAFAGFLAVLSWVFGG